MKRWLIKRKRGYEVIDGMVYDLDYVPTEEELNDPAAQELLKEHLRKLGCLPPDMWDAKDFRNYYEIKKWEVGKRKAREMIMDRINEIRNDTIVEAEYGFCWGTTCWGDYGGEIRRGCFWDSKSSDDIDLHRVVKGKCGMETNP